MLLNYTQNTIILAFLQTAQHHCFLVKFRVASLQTVNSKHDCTVQVTRDLIPKALLHEVKNTIITTSLFTAQNFR